VRVCSPGDHRVFGERAQGRYVQRMDQSLPEIVFSCQLALLGQQEHLGSKQVTLALSLRPGAGSKLLYGDAMKTTSTRRTGISPTRCRSSRRPMSSRRGPVVLIVDDCMNLRAALKFILWEMANIHAVGAATSEEALKLVRRCNVDAVISDIVRPGMDGLEFLRICKQLRPSVPIIIASGVLDDATARRARRLRAFECLPKPFSCCQLVAAVRAAIASGRMCRTVLWSRRRARFTSEL